MDNIKGAFVKNDKGKLYKIFTLDPVPTVLMGQQILIIGDKYEVIENSEIIISGEVNEIFCLDELINDV